MIIVSGESVPKEVSLMARNPDRIVHTESFTPYRRVLSASSLSDYVLNRMNEDVGSIKEIMIDVPSCRIRGAVGR
jgi:hypothetical protein